MFLESLNFMFINQIRYAVFKLTNNTKVGEGSTSKVEPPDGLLLLDPLDGFACIN